MEPSEDVIKEIKAKFPGRSIHLVEAIDGEDVHSFVMTGPTKADYQKYSDEMLSAGTAKTEPEKRDRARVAIERAALAQIRWPDREDVEALFIAKPGLSVNFAEEIHKLAGTNAEVRSKKL